VLVNEDTIAGYVQGIEDSARRASLATTAALAPAATPAALAPAAAPQAVQVTSGDALIAALLDRVREAIRNDYSGDPNAALATVSI
jgi:hypothetical protein